jgi:hypothetical protein
MNGRMNKYVTESSKAVMPPTRTNKLLTPLMRITENLRAKFCTHKTKKQIWGVWKSELTELYRFLYYQ